MGDGTKEHPYTREDVLKKIEENGGTAKHLDLSGKVFEQGIDLRGIPGSGLQEVILKGADLRMAHFEGANLALANLEEADLWDAHFEKAVLGFTNLQRANLAVADLEKAYLADANLQEAVLQEANLQEAVLQEANLKGANLFEANLKEAYFWKANLEAAILVNTNLQGTVLQETNLKKANLVWARFSADTEFEGADWGDYILGEEKAGDFSLANEVYWRLRHWHASAGLHDIAANFFFREMTTKRKTMKWWPNPLNRAFAKLVSVLCGYGEKPERVVISAVVIIFGLAAAYSLWGSFDKPSFLETLYYSVVSFMAVGYGNWAPQPTGWAKGMGAAEAVIGVFMMALFLVTFTRKMTR